MEKEEVKRIIEDSILYKTYTCNRSFRKDAKVLFIDLNFENDFKFYVIDENKYLYSLNEEGFVERSLLKLNIEVTDEGGIVCDNEDCDYSIDEKDIDDIRNFVNLTCEKCGENLLTEKDLSDFLTVQNYISLLNNMSNENMKKYLSDSTGQDLTDIPQDEDVVECKIKCHNGIKFIKD